MFYLPFLFLFLSAPSDAAIGFPKLFFSYSYLFDRQACKAPVEEAWSLEAVSKESHFSELWRHSESDLFATLKKKFKGGFSRKELTVTLSACPTVVSFSDPLVIKVTWYLKSFMGKRTLAKDIRFVQTLFHELLHTWVIENLRNSRLLKKYANENQKVKNHLHLMAIEQFVYIHAKRKDLLEVIETEYPKHQDEYARAWEIVQNEGYPAFINEFETK